MKDEYETQINIPKPILIEIFELCGIENFLKISLISKQFYFLLKSDNLWLKMLRKTVLTEEEIEEQRKTQALVEIYKDTLIGWNDKDSNLNKLQFDRNLVVHNNQQGVAIALTKKIFVTGEENLLFEFESNFKGDLNGCGICILKWFNFLFNPFI